SPCTIPSEIKGKGRLTNTTFHVNEGNCCRHFVLFGVGIGGQGNSSLFPSFRNYGPVCNLIFINSPRLEKNRTRLLHVTNCSTHFNELSDCDLGNFQVLIISFVLQRSHTENLAKFNSLWSSTADNSRRV